MELYFSDILPGVITEISTEALSRVLSGTASVSSGIPLIVLFEISLVILQGFNAGVPHVLVTEILAEIPLGIPS